MACAYAAASATLPKTALDTLLLCYPNILWRAIFFSIAQLTIYLLLFGAHLLFNRRTPAAELSLNFNAHLFA